jgi:peptidoglycan hydrolase-like protein with peptidoglycan-binding domain
LKPELKNDELFEFETLELESPSSMPTLRIGSRGSAVIDVQRRLATAGFSAGPADGIFGSLTDSAVRSFQSARGLGADGIVGSQTWSALFGTAPTAPTPQPPPSTGSPSDPQVTVPSGVLISENAVRVLKSILRSAGLSRASVTSGRRTTSEQARIMYNLIEGNGVSYAKNLYGSNGDRVIDEYVAAKAAGKTATDIKLAMETKIKQLGCQNVSHHCSDSYDVFDVAPSSITNSSAFRRALDSAVFSGAIKMYLSPPEDPAFHIEIALAA